VVAATSATAGWEVATAALAAAAKARVAVLLVVGRAHAADAAGDLLRATVATYVEVHAGGADPLRVDDVITMTHALARTHDLVLVGAVDGLLVPLGRGGWTLADLAWALPAPVVVVTGAGPDSTNHTTLALDALSSRRISASVTATTSPSCPSHWPVGSPAARPTGRSSSWSRPGAGWIRCCTARAASRPPPVSLRPPVSPPPTVPPPHPTPHPTPHPAMRRPRRRPRRSRIATGGAPRSSASAW